MNGQKHIIKREILELTVPEREIALPIQNKASEFVKYRLNPELDKLFSKLSGTDEIVQIDSLVLDLGTLSLKNLDEDFIQLALKNAEEQLTELIFKAKTESETSEKSTPEVEAKKVKIKSLKTNNLDQFIHFLETGNLSWWKSDGSENPLNTIFEQVLLIDKSSLQKQLTPLLKNPKVRKRLAYQFSEEQLKVILEKINTKPSKNKTAFLKTIQTFFAESKEGSPFYKEAFWETVFKSISKEITLTTDSQKITFIKTLLDESSKVERPVSQEKSLSFLLKKLVLEYQKEPDKNLQFIAIAILGFSIETGLNTKKLLSLVQKSTIQKNKGFQETLERIEKNIKSSETIQKEIDHTKKTETDDQEKTETTLKEPLEKEEISLQKPGRKIPVVDEIFISNAGLVLLHPYLKFFFDGLGLLDKELQFNNFDHAVKAIHLLQFIVTRTQTNPENELSLNKILCGLDISEPVPKNVRLTKAEMDECENLLSVVLDRWEVLKTKKTEALRENFLKREGFLTTENQGWNLKIERNSIDVLLDKLPWGISLIKLPWTEQIIHVEW